MTVVVHTHDRCRICFSLLLRDRSLCCQKSYHLFKHIERRKLPLNKFNRFQIKIRNETVCFRDLIFRYLHTQIHQTRNFSNLICYDCSMILLDIEQCAKYLRKTINQLKLKFNKSNRLRTSSLSATFQKKKQSNTTIKDEQLPIINSDSDEEVYFSPKKNFFSKNLFQEFDEDEEDDEIKPNVSTHIKSTSPSSSSGESSSSKHNRECNDDEEEVGLMKISPQKSQPHEFFHPLSSSNGLITTRNLLEDTNSNLLQLRLAHMMAAANTGQHLNENNNNDAMMNTFANMQRNFLLQFLSDPIAAAHAAQAAATAAAHSASQTKANLTPMSLITSNNKQIGSGRKRKSTPEKRVVTNHRSSNNNGDVSILCFIFYTVVAQSTLTGSKSFSFITGNPD